MTTREQSVIADLERFIAAKDDSLHLPREAAAFVHGLVSGRRPMLSVEIGTSYGYSGLWIGAGIRRFGGRLITIDRSDRKAEHAARTFAEADLQDCIECRCGEAVDVIATLEGPVEFVLNDADKEDCRRYVEMLLPLMPPEGVILTDNTTTHAGQLAGFIEWVRGRDDVWSTEVPIGNGMELTVKQ